MNGAPSVTNSRFNYFISGLLGNAIWGFIAIPFRMISAWPSDTILYFRIFTSCAFIWLFVFAFRYSEWKRDWVSVKSLPSNQRNRLLGLILLSSILIIGNWFTFIYAVNNVSIKSAAFAYLVCPLITTLAGYFILKEKLSRIKWFSLGLALCSIIMLTQTSLNEVVWSVVVALFYAFYLIIQRVLRDIDKFNFLAVQVLFCSILTLPLFFIRQEVVPSSFLFWTVIVVIAIAFTIIPLFLSMYSLKGISSATLGILIYINPIISFAVAIYYFNEVISLNQLIAYSLLLIAIGLYNSAFVRQFFSKFAKGKSI